MEICNQRNRQKNRDEQIEIVNKKLEDHITTKTTKESITAHTLGVPITRAWIRTVIVSNDYSTAYKASSEQPSTKTSRATITKGGRTTELEMSN